MKSTKLMLASSRMKWKSMKHTLGTRITRAKTMTQITSKTGTNSTQPQTPQDVTIRMVTVKTTLTNPAPKETTTIAMQTTTKRTPSKTNRLMYQ